MIKFHKINIIKFYYIFFYNIYENQKIKNIFF